MHRGANLQQGLSLKEGLILLVERNLKEILNFFLTLSNPTSGRGLFSRGGGPQGPPLEINEGASGEQDSQNTIFNTHKIRIVCKI